MSESVNLQFKHLNNGHYGQIPEKENQVSEIFIVYVKLGIEIYFFYTFNIFLLETFL